MLSTDKRQRMTSDVSVSYYRYAGFFHFRDSESIPPLVQWLRERSREFSASLEKMDASNPSDRHIQWAMVCEREWSRSDTAVFTASGKMGRYLVKEKHANVGCKHAKRWSKIDAVKAGYSWRSSLLYVAKDVPEDDFVGKLWWEKEGACMPLAEIAGKFRAEPKKPKNEGGKVRSFFDVCCEWYESVGKPNDENEIIDGLLRQGMFGKWTYCDPHCVIKMVSALRLKYHNDHEVEAMKERILRIKYGM